MSSPQSPSESDRLCDEGYALLEAARFDEARAALSRARDLAPDNPLIHYRLGLLFSDTAQPVKALEAIDVSLRLDPGNARAHNNRGSALQVLGRLPEATAAFQQALALDPKLEPPYINLGHLLELQGKVREAAQLYSQAIARGLDPTVFNHYLAAVSGQGTQRAPDRWVSATFDNFAPTFDSHLKALGYNAPTVLAAMLRSHVTQLLDVLDLGCGTGQCGLALTGQKHYLVGVDLSEKMLALARAHGVYDELQTGDLTAWMRGSAAARFDLVIAADVLVYIGALEDLFREVTRILRPGGWFAFSTEECLSPDFKLLPTGRYAQSEDYIRRLALPGFTVTAADPTIIRTEGNTPLRGRLYLLQKRPQTA